jgi:capsular exopolysaccharide synthesis family protein
VTVLSMGYTLNSVRSEIPRYRSTATVRLVDASQAIGGDLTGRQPTAEMPFSSTSDPIQSQIQILQSEAVVSIAVDLKGLRLLPGPQQPFPAEIGDVTVANNASATAIAVAFGPDAFTLQSNGRTTRAPYGSAATIDGVTMVVTSRPSVPSTNLRVVPKDQAMAAILASFGVTNRSRTDILDLYFTAEEPNITKRVTNAMAEAYQVHNTTTAQQFSRRRREFLEGQLRQTEATLNAANNALSSFRAGRQSTIAQAAAQTTQATRTEEARQQLLVEKQSLDAVLARFRDPSRPSSATIRALAASPAVLTNGIVSQLFAQLVAQEEARDNLLSLGAAPTNPDLVVANSRIRATQTRLIDALESQSQTVDARLAALGPPGSGGGGGALASVPAGETREAQLAMDVQSAQKLANDLKAELQQAQMSEAIEAGQVEVVQLARNPGYRVASGKQRRLLLSAIVGLMFGFGAAVLLDNLDKRVRRRGDIEPMLGVPGLVVIPRLASAGAVKNPLLRALPKRRLPSAERQANAALDLVTLTDPRSPSAEAFRTLRTNLMFSQAVREMRTLVVTSASPGEGKTVTASNLAVSFAQQGMRVLLIDCDLRRGRAHRMFNVPREPGMSDYLLGFADDEAVTHETIVPGLYMIPSGKLPPNPAELLGGDVAKQKLGELNGGYDLLILDTPPLLAASDAAILATLSDGVIMVLRAGATETNAAQQATQQLQTIGARVVGAVLNDPDSQVAKFGAYYEYNYAAQPEPGQPG